MSRPVAEVVCRVCQRSQLYYFEVASAADVTPADVDKAFAFFGQWGWRPPLRTPSEPEDWTCPFCARPS